MPESHDWSQPGSVESSATSPESQAPQEIPLRVTVGRFLTGALYPARRLSFAFITLLTIVYLSFFGLDVWGTSGAGGGVGWDRHIILPVLVLAARPIAQISRVAYLTLSEVLAQDYVRTARSKGLSSRMVMWGHVYRNVAIPVLTTLGASLRFALSSLPVDESRQVLVPKLARLNV